MSSISTVGQLRPASQTLYVEPAARPAAIMALA
jgi:hypothetical protein